MHTYADWKPYQAHNGNANTLRSHVPGSIKIIDRDILQLLNIYWLTKCVRSMQKAPLVAIKCWSTKCWFLLCYRTNTGSADNRHHHHHNHSRHNALLSSFNERSLINTHYAKLQFSLVGYCVAKKLLYKNFRKNPITSLFYCKQFIARTM